MSAQASRSGPRVARPGIQSDDAKVFGPAKASGDDRRAGSPERDQEGRRLLAREKLRRVLASKGTASFKEPAREPGKEPETRRTPGSAAGCNKPARLRAEKAIRTVRNREGGTRPARWQRQADVLTQKEKATSQETAALEWTHKAQVDGGASLETPRENPDRKVR